MMKKARLVKTVASLAVTAAIIAALVVPGSIAPNHTAKADAEMTLNQADIVREISTKRERFVKYTIL